MDRREFLTAGSGALGAACAAGRRGEGSPLRPGAEARALFPRLEHEIHLDAAGGTPQGRFAEEGLRIYADYWRHGAAVGNFKPVNDAVTAAHTGFARLVGVVSSEIALVHCTKAGEQIVLDGLPRLRARAGNVVTNDLHFSGSIHNLIGLRGTGLDVRIVRATDWDLSLEAMAEVIDEETALVTVSHVSNVNGRIEPLRELTELAHSNGALVYADIIQSAGIVPLDLRALGVDFAACSGYKWLFGPHGVGFFYVRQELQGSALPDHLFPGYAGHNYAPWVPGPVGAGDFHTAPQERARRYQPGHISYLGYCALAEAIAFIELLGVEALLEHSVGLNRLLLERLDSARYEVITPDADRSPILTLRARQRGGRASWDALAAAHIRVSGFRDRVRVSPAAYNVDEDIERLAQVLNAS